MHLSSAIATYLACGKDLIKSCELGIKYVNEAIKSKLNLGKGNGPINHLNLLTYIKNLDNENVVVVGYSGDEGKERLLIGFQARLM